MIKFKTPKEEKEWNELQTHNKRLHSLVRALDVFAELEIGKDIVITHLHRSQEEHDQLYAQTPPGLRPKSSPHMHWKAVDLRSSIYTPIEIDRMVRFLNQFSNKNGKRVAFVHQITGNALHFHIQLLD